MLLPDVEAMPDVDARIKAKYRVVRTIGTKQNARPRGLFTPRSQTVVPWVVCHCWTVAASAVEELRAAEF